MMFNVLDLCLHRHTGKRAVEVRNVVLTFPGESGMSLRIPLSRKWLRPRLDSMNIVVDVRLEGVDEAGRPWHRDISDVMLVAGKYISALSCKVAAWKLAAKGRRQRKADA